MATTVSRSDGKQAEGGHSGFVLMTASITALGGILFGYDTGVISAALLYITPDFHLGTQMQQVVVSALLLGAIFGALGGGRLADGIGRKKTLMASAATFVVGALIAAIAPGVVVLIAARVILGVAIGSSSVVVPLYIAEIAPKESRGKLVSLNQLMITVGIFVAYLVGFALAASKGWREMFALGAVPALGMFAGLFLLPESPRWLVSRDRIEDARGVLQRSRPASEVDPEVQEMQDQAAEENATSYADLRKPELRPALMLGVGVAAINQLVGVNAVIYYAPTLLKQAGFGDSAATLATVGIGLVNMLLTATALLMIDKVGRRPLLLGGLAAVTAALVFLGALNLLPTLHGAARYALVGGLCVYIASFAASLGISIWLVNSEVFPTAIRGKAASLGTFTHWSLDFVIALTVLTLINAITATGLFWTYAVFGVLGWIFLFRKLPETKGRSLEDIDAALQAGETGRSAAPAQG